ncbi:MAG: IS5 family transposase [Halobacteria archaeon]
MQSYLAHFARTCVSLAKKVCDGEKPAVKKGDGGYSDWVMVSLHAIKHFRDHTYWELVDDLIEMPRIRSILELDFEDIPHISTISNRKQSLPTELWRKLLKYSSYLHELGNIQAIDSTGFDRNKKSRKYKRRTGYGFKALKTTILVDCKNNVVLDVALSTNKPHDTKVAWKLLSKNLDKLDIITGDKGFDSDELRSFLRENGVRPVIKHREFTSLDKAHNKRIDDDVYHQRSNSESVFFSLRKRYDDYLAGKWWYNHYKEVVLKCAVKNIEDHIRNKLKRV